MIRTLASTEKPLFSHVSMSAAAAVSSRRVSLNQRITRQRTRSVSAARSAWLIGRAGRNAGGVSHRAPSAGGTKTPSVAHTCRCTWRLSAEPKRCRKDTAPSRGRAAAGALASLVSLAEEQPAAYKDVDVVVDVVHRAGLSLKVARLTPLGVIKG